MPSWDASPHGSPRQREQNTLLMPNRLESPNRPVCGARHSQSADRVLVTASESGYSCSSCAWCWAARRVGVRVWAGCRRAPRMLWADCARPGADGRAAETPRGRCRAGRRAAVQSHRPGPADRRDPGPAFDPALVRAVDSELCELHPGDGDGLAVEECAARYGSFDPHAEPDRPVSPGSESFNQFTRRVGRTMHRPRTRISRAAAGRGHPCGIHRRAWGKVGCS